ncbi:MAG TPA: redoxin domain-containing protein [Bacteroidetes bacterium]|nr:redoxin domain-containing protein [Bacteroidota bacterium]
MAINTLNFMASKKLCIFVLSLAFFLLPSFVFSQKIGYQIKLKVDNFEETEAYLGYFFGDKQYIKDTAYVEQDGQFYFEGNEKLDPGIYIVVLPPDNQYFQILVGEDEQWFSVETKAPGFDANMKIKGSKDNQLFYSYLNYLNEKRPEAKALREKLEAEKDEKKKAKLEEKLKTIDDGVKAYQQKIVSQNPQTMTAAVIKANLPLDIPEFKGKDKTESDMMAFYWMRKHWFDNIDLGDDRMVRTPFLFKKVQHYIEKMTVQHPDSISVAIDKVLEKAKPAENTFKFYLIHFLNKYAKSKIVGMDAVYVHIVDKYYKTGQAPWTEEEQLKKIIENADKLEPLLIGKIAPNIQMQYQDGSPVQLHDFKSPITVLFFWDPDCGHCKKSMPAMVDFAKKYKDKGVAVFSICTKLVTRDDEGKFSMKEVDKCWSAIEERNMDVFWNTVDPYHRSRYKTVYDIRSTPQIYVLDTDKTILSKRIGAEQLPEVVDHILLVKEKGGNGD